MHACMHACVYVLDQNVVENVNKVEMWGWFSKFMECAGQNVPDAHRIFIDIKVFHSYMCAFLILEAVNKSNHLNFNRKINCIQYDM